ncbi:TRAPP subunit bet5 [Penicillium rubens]|nr:TRAPP subunit bet5 [Penicillium rubens]
MVVYSFYIFDRHAECIYKRRWLPRPTSTVGKSRSDTVSGAAPTGLGQTVRSTDDDSKLVFGTVFSLRNMVRKLGGEDDNFVSFTTSQYKLHYYETPTNTKFVMLTDLKSPSMRIALQQIYINLFVEYVVKNPLSPTEHPGGVGVNNELFEESLEQFVEPGDQFARASPRKEGENDRISPLGPIDAIIYKSGISKAQERHSCNRAHTAADSPVVKHTVLRAPACDGTFWRGK